MTGRPTESVPSLNQIETDDVTGLVRELNQRSNGGVTVTLLWNPQTNRVFVSVVEERHGVAFVFPVPAADAADAFHHPYVYSELAYEEHALAA